MIIINGTVAGQRLTLDRTVVATGITIGQLKISFSPEWDGYAKVAVFFKDKDKPYRTLFNDDGVADIPSEVANETGTCFIGVFGTLDNKVITTEAIGYNFRMGAITKDLLVPDPTPDIYTQLLSAYNTLGGAITDERLKSAVDSYIDEHPDSTKGATDEQVAQISQNASDISQLKSNIGNTIYKGLINGFDKDNTVGGYLGNDGNVRSDSRFVTSDYSDVYENKTYYALQMVNAVKYDIVSYICFYDSSKTFIAGGYFHASSCTSPNGSKYARVTFPSDETVKARCMFTSIETPDKYYPFGYEYSIITKDVSELKTNVSELKTRKFENRLYGKTMAILGDSMAKGHTLSEKQTWAYKIANRNSMTYQKLAINGTFITTGHGDADANCLLEQAKKINNNPDIIVIHMGTNDRNKNVKLGTWTSVNTDTTNLFGALRVVFTYLAENFPLAQVMFITPYYYQEQTDYIGSIEKACMCVGWHCKNNKQGEIWAWNTNVKNALFLDTVHLNEVGQERVSYEYEGLMRTFM